MVVILALLVACSSAPPPEEAAVAEQLGAPSGSIIGEPILPVPMIIGGIDNAVVEEGILRNMDSINICYQAELPSNPGLSGKVLVKFQIGMDGGVANVSTRSTSLRNEAVETCVNAEVTKVKFPPLERGRLAIVHYPFVFPLPQATN